MNNTEPVVRTNIVNKSAARAVQKATFEELSKTLANSFGPDGSTTAIVKSVDMSGAGVEILYTKDGYNIIKNIQFLNSIERSVQSLLTDLTLEVVKKVGDGTTSAVILSNEIFKELCENTRLDEYTSSDIIKLFSKTIKDICDYIYKMGRECTLDDIYNICLISTNNNEEISQTIYQLYKKFGLDTYIDVGISNEINNIVKEYDGMTLETGYTNICFVNDKSNNTARVPKPRIYCFQDPIDTPEMLGFLDKILETNILRCYQKDSKFMPIPTVILCKSLTPDSSSYFESIVKLMNAYPGMVPLLIVSDIHQDYLYEDIVQMIGAKWIKKYLNPDLQQKDIKAGLAPTIDTICDFCGYAEEVRSDQLKTQIIKPAKMFNPDGSYSDEYNTMLRYLKTQIDKAVKENAGITEIARTKRRYNSFKGNMVDFLVGGVTLADREALKTAVEDAILNCRSAVVHGVGYGSNFMGLNAVMSLMIDDSKDENIMLDIIYKAYKSTLRILYKELTSDEEIDNLISESISNGCPLNIRTNEFDHKVLASIETDPVILKTIDKIITLMFTTNQYLVPTPAHNIYELWENK